MGASRHGNGGNLVMESMQIDSHANAHIGGAILTGERPPVSSKIRRVRYSKKSSCKTNGLRTGASSSAHSCFQSLKIRFSVNRRGSGSSRPCKAFCTQLATNYGVPCNIRCSNGLQTRVYLTTEAGLPSKTPAVFAFERFFIGFAWFSAGLGHFSESLLELGFLRLFKTPSLPGNLAKRWKNILVRIARLIFTFRFRPTLFFIVIYINQRNWSITITTRSVMRFNVLLVFNVMSLLLRNIKNVNI